MAAEGHAVADDGPDAPPPLVDEGGQRQQVGVNGRELHGGSDDQVDEFKLRVRAALDTAKVGKERIPANAASFGDLRREVLQPRRPAVETALEVAAAARGKRAHASSMGGSSVFTRRHSARQLVTRG